MESAEQQAANPPDIDYHLRQAIGHLEIALSQSVASIAADGANKQAVGGKWERFLGEFLGQVREQGRKSGINMLGLVSFPRLDKKR